MKVLLISPTDFNNYRKVQPGRIPLNLLYIASYLRQHQANIELKVIDCIAEKLSLEKTNHIIKKYSPDLVGITLVTEFYNSAINLTKNIKQIIPNCKIVFGGLHASALPKEIIKNDFIDFVLAGEAEIAFHNLCGYLNGKLKITSVPGLYYKKKGKIKSNKIKFIKDLDSLPFPARELVNQKLYFTKYSKKTTSIMVSRGCPYSCIYCAHKLAFGQKIRRRSIKNVIEEIKHCIAKYDIHSFEFIDSLFISSNKYTKKLCEQIIKDNLKITWRCQTRIDSFIPNKNNMKKDIIQLIKLMKRSGCQRIYFGIDSGNEEILRINKKSQKLNEIKEVIDLINKQGIKTQATFVLGLLGENKKTIQDTFDFANTLNLDDIYYTRAYAYPGTEFYDKLADAKKIKKKYWIKGQDIIYYDNFTSKDLDKIIKSRLLKSKLSPVYLARQLILLIKNPSKDNIRSFLYRTKKVIKKIIS